MPPLYIVFPTLRIVSLLQLGPLSTGHLSEYGGFLLFTPPFQITDSVYAFTFHSPPRNMLFGWNFPLPCEGKQIESFLYAFDFGGRSRDCWEMLRIVTTLMDNGGNIYCRISETSCRHLFDGCPCPFQMRLLMFSLTSSFQKEVPNH
ncbi:hypothetical protein CEXT_788741 [Caerostris extrusa]|uniref:Uncharacterized protein n=1 Tax=Caerostris extrusa TaxID=172846 RepID=A0AAV4XPT5_CAEEX|nr:hypothetical protein CEXT_788741 [Caerostris extrusa]